jgi:hypothetical protein
MFDRIRERTQGFRTLLACGAVAAVGVADAAGAVDITPLVSAFVSDKAAVGTIMCVLAIFFGVLRFLTSTSVFHDRYDSQIAPLKGHVDEGH